MQANNNNFLLIILLKKTKAIMRAQLLKTVEHTMSKQLLFLSMLWFVTHSKWEN